MDGDSLKILLVADFFGRDRSTGAKRANAFAKYWAREPGVTVTALTSHKMDIPLNEAGSVDLGPDVTEVRVHWPDLLGMRERQQREAAPAANDAVNGDAKAHKRSGIPWRAPLRFLSDLLAIPDRYAMWALGGATRGAFLPKPDVVVATAPSFVNLVVARLLAARYGVPYICDLRDPWHDNPFRPVYTGALGAWNNRLERFALSGASRIWVTTPEIEDQYMVRGDLTHADRIKVIANGYDEEEWSSTEPRRRERDGIEILHAGNFYSVRSPIPFIEDLGRVLRDAKQPFNKPIRVRFLGACDSELRTRIDTACAEHGLEDIVRFEDSVELRLAIQAQMDSDLLLLMGHRSDKPVTQVPLKLYEALRAGRPQLAYFQKNSAPAQFARRHPEFGIHLLDLDDPDSRPRVLESVLRAFDAERVSVDAESVTKYERSRLAAGALADLRTLLARTAT